MKIPSCRGIVVASPWCIYGLKPTQARGGSIKYTEDFTTIFIVSPGDVESARFVLPSRSPRDASRIALFDNDRERERERSVELG